MYADDIDLGSAVRRERALIPLTVRACKRTLRHARGLLLFCSIAMLIPWLVVAKAPRAELVVCAVTVTAIGMIGVIGGISMLTKENMIKYYELKSKESSLIGKFLCFFGRHDFFDIKESGHRQHSDDIYAPGLMVYDKVCVRPHCHRIRLDAYNLKREEEYQNHLKRQRQEQIQTAVNSFLQQAPEDVTANVLSKSLETGKENEVTSYNAQQSQPPPPPPPPPRAGGSFSADYKSIYEAVNEAIKEMNNSKYK